MSTKYRADNFVVKNIIVSNLVVGKSEYVCRTVPATEQCSHLANPGARVDTSAGSEANGLENAHGDAVVDGAAVVNSGLAFESPL
jgi:hypothetical protein